jgi:hypothetical protein
MENNANQGCPKSGTTICEQALDLANNALRYSTTLEEAIALLNLSAGLIKVTLSSRSVLYPVPDPPNKPEHLESHGA